MLMLSPATLKCGGSCPQNHKFDYFFHKIFTNRTSENLFICLLGWDWQSWMWSCMYKLSFSKTGDGIFTVPFPSGAGPFSISPKYHLLTMVSCISPKSKLVSSLHENKMTGFSKARGSLKTTMSRQVLRYLITQCFSRTRRLSCMHFKINADA